MYSESTAWRSLSNASSLNSGSVKNWLKRSSAFSNAL
ncbi:hypothetical protein D049_1929A, partial [Vibrio parahaemolyticus VPTS-2010]